MLVNSWKSSLAAYGICTCAILVVFLQGRHSYVWGLSFLERVLVIVNVPVATVNLRNRCHQPAALADMYAVGIRHFKQSFFQKRRRAVTDHAITLHFSETQTAVSRTTFDGLASKNLHWTTGTSMDLVIDHMPQSLVVSRTQEHLRSELFASMSVVHDLETA